eukprot:gnl/MRDRNA2_/MRDRNA2_127436_c0_seq1.p1 gnl/MRDRNA2_/MRDRNA2_127436_c0~~gnl/MRDRNA2_/MRDRNA2_127436_c0_seq1.p1  ORF type:complete len:424 (+),score=74.11 gnl/MRDRNA2_/MRDRNA2_127436_c0_seq1:25-1272(+)
MSRPLLVQTPCTPSPVHASHSQRLVQHLPGAVLTPQGHAAELFSLVGGYPTPKRGTVSPLGRAPVLPLFHANPLATPVSRGCHVQRDTDTPNYVQREQQSRRASNLRRFEELANQCNLMATAEPPEPAQGSLSPSKRQRPKPPPLQDLTDELNPSFASEALVEPVQPVASPIINQMVMIGGRSPTLYFGQSRTMTPNGAAAYSQGSPVYCTNPDLGMTGEALEFVGANRVIETTRPVTAPEQPTELQKTVAALKGKASQSKIGNVVKTFVDRVKKPGQTSQANQTKQVSASATYVQTVLPDHARRRKDLQWQERLQDWGVFKSNWTVVESTDISEQQRALAMAQQKGQKVEKYIPEIGGWTGVHVQELQACEQRISVRQSLQHRARRASQIEEVLQAALGQENTSTGSETLQVHW